MPLIIPAMREALDAAKINKCFNKNQNYKLLLLIKPKSALARNGQEQNFADMYLLISFGQNNRYKPHIIESSFF